MCEWHINIAHFSILACNEVHQKHSACFSRHRTVSSNTCGEQLLWCILITFTLVPSVMWWWCIFLQHYCIHMGIDYSKKYLGIIVILTYSETYQAFLKHEYNKTSTHSNTLQSLEPCSFAAGYPMLHLQSDLRAARYSCTTSKRYLVICTSQSC